MLLSLSRHLKRTEYLYQITCPKIHQRSCSSIVNGPLFASTRHFAKPRARHSIISTWLSGTQRRGAKRKATLTLHELPQGNISSTPLPPLDDVEPEYPPLLQQVRNNIVKFSHCVLLTRVGGFYEVLPHHS